MIKEYKSLEVRIKEDTDLKMAKMDPMETRQSMLELPSRGSKVTMYFPWRSVSTSISFSFS